MEASITTYKLILTSGTEIVILSCKICAGNLFLSFFWELANEWYCFNWVSYLRTEEWINACDLGWAIKGWPRMALLPLQPFSLKQRIWQFLPRYIANMFFWNKKNLTYNTMEYTKVKRKEDRKAIWTETWIFTQDSLLFV